MSSSPSETDTYLQWSGREGEMLNRKQTCFLSFLHLFSNNLYKKILIAEKHYGWAVLFFCFLLCSLLNSSINVLKYLVGV